MKKTITLSLVGAALLATTGVAAAQGGQDAPRRGPAAEVTRDQALARADARFARLDANSDGRVTADEARQVRQGRRAERQGQRFDRLDTNRDGVLSREEFSQRQAVRAERREGRGMRAGRQGRRGGGEARAARLFGADGVLTRDEFRARALQRFERLDLNRDGTITVAERQEAGQRLRAERQNRRRAPQN
ncbi:MAG: EF-hand domain-containing protein [Allosphingosinicella sp.]|uniref:EF-hand domain-containing protein n=1 Tax=Allosphingosinicella sp. TaxID=2823234 RepID=UPI003924B565